MTEHQRRVDRAAETFGDLVRARRKALGLRQEDVALAAGVGRRFVIELEAGKSTCQLGPTLLVAAALGITPGVAPEAAVPDLPEID